MQKGDDRADTDKLRDATIDVSLAATQTLGIRPGHPRDTESTIQQWGTTLGERGNSKGSVRPDALFPSKTDRAEWPALQHSGAIER
jgi:hypothetical protein